MFDTYLESLGSSHHYHHHNVNVTEKRAPTDESIRMLKEMQDAAGNSLLYVGDLPNTLLHAKMLVVRDWRLQGFTILVVASIKGKGIKAETALNFETILQLSLSSDRDKLEYCQKLAAAALSQRLAEEVTSSLCKEMAHPFPF